MFSDPILPITYDFCPYVDPKFVSACVSGDGASEQDCEDLGCCYVSSYADDYPACINPPPVGKNCTVQ